MRGAENPGRARGDPDPSSSATPPLPRRDARGLRQQRRLALTLLAPRRGRPARTRSASSLADDRDDEVEASTSQFSPSAKVNVCVGSEEEPVEREHARNRDGQRVGKPPRDGRKEDGEDVERAEGEHGIHASSTPTAAVTSATAPALPSTPTTRSEVSRRRLLHRAMLSTIDQCAYLEYEHSERPPH